VARTNAQWSFGKPYDSKYNTRFDPKGIVLMTTPQHRLAGFNDERHALILLRGKNQYHCARQSGTLHAWQCLQWPEIGPSATDKIESVISECLDLPQETAQNKRVAQSILDQLARERFGLSDTYEDHQLDPEDDDDDDDIDVIETKAYV
jgi:hypothetical protein